MTERPRQSLINGLLVFASAAKHGSFTRASEELQISQPAVSHAVGRLEQELGVALFERRHKGVSPTPAGRYLAEQAGLGLTLIEQALAEIRLMDRTRQVTLAVSTATATWWLLPRIARFKQAHPDIELRCITTDTDLDLERERIDLAITLGTGVFPRLQRWHFVDENISPVCSPDYARRLSPLKDPQSLVRGTLLHIEQRYKPRLDWAGWLAGFGVSLPRNSKGIHFNDYSVILQAAMEGQGIALGWRHITDALVAQGSLVYPVPQSVSTGQPYYIVASRSRRPGKDALHLRDWLIAEAKATGTTVSAKGSRKDKSRPSR